MNSVLIRAEDVLRRRRWPTESAEPWVAVRRLVGLIALFGMLYGAVMGSFGGLAGDRLWQVVFAAVKVPMLLLVTFSICLPSFFVLNTIFGLRRDFIEAVRALIAAQAGMAILLGSLAPLTAFWYAGSDSYDAALRFNLAAFAVATFGAQLLLRGYYQPLVRRNERQRWMLWLWMVIYGFVGVQMAWVLRPFVGSANTPVSFFREEAWGNAYVVVLELLGQMFSKFFT